MYIHFTRTPKIWPVIAGLLFWINLSVTGQFYPIRIDITVVPPYTSNLNEYINTPNKIVANISYASMDYNDVDVYLKGSITSDNGILIRTKDSYKPAHPLHLTRGMVYTLTPSDLSEMFDMNQLESSGIKMKELYSGAGLPEDNYQICIRVYDYETGMPLSNEEPLGCSNYFMITNFEPPLVTTPFCGDSINISPIQNAMISWTTPAGTIGTQYKFELIEIPEGIDIDPNDAFQSSFQTIFEEILSVNIINLTSDKVLLTPGYTYAFRVQATDPMGNNFFRNAGYSEVCYFVCKEDKQTDTENTSYTSELANNLKELEEQFELIPNTIISGKLLAKFPDNPNSGIVTGYVNSFNAVVNSSENVNEVQVAVVQTNSQSTTTKSFSYGDISQASSKLQSDVDDNSVSFGGTNFFPSTSSYRDMLEVKRTPYYYYGNTEEIVNVKPLANTEIRLVARWAFNTAGSEWGIAQPEYRNRKITELFDFVDLEGNTCDPTRFVNIVLATATTEESGDFTFNFNSNFVTGKAIIDYQGEPKVDEYEIAPEDYILGEIESFLSGSIKDIVVNPLKENTGVTNQGFSANNTLSASEVTQQYNNLASLSNQNLVGSQNAGEYQTMSFTLEGGGTYLGYVCLKIEVVDPKFCSPDIDIFAMPGDVLEVPTQVAKLKTYNLKVTAYAPDIKHQTAVANEPMDNVRLSIYRDMQNIDNEKELILNYEGQKLKTKTINNNGEFKNVAIDTSGISPNAFCYIKNLVKHANIYPQYYMELSTRNSDDYEDDYEFTRYNYRTIFKALETNSLNNAYQKTNSNSLNGYPEYNHQYLIPEIEISETMEALQPEIKGRVMTKTNYQVTSIKNVRVEMYEQPNDNQTFNYAGQFSNYVAVNNIEPKSTDYTNDVGIFRFSDLEIKQNIVGDIIGPYRRLYISHPAYISTTRPIPTMQPWNLSFGMLKDIKDVFLEPLDLIHGLVEDEDGDAVSSYVKSATSPFYTTYPFEFLQDTLQFFDVPSVHYGTKITVQPKSSQYFSRDTVFSIPPNKRVKIIVYKKLHRPKIVVKNKLGEPIPGAIVELGEQTPDTTDSNGIVRFKFASPGDQFIIRIKPPLSYAPIQEPVKIHVTPQDTVITYVLDNARSIQGTVTETGSNEPIADALIYSELENTDGTILYIEAKTNDEGKYVLAGIPRSINSLKVYAVKKGNNPSYVGTSKTVTFSQNNSFLVVVPTHNFELKRLDNWDLSSIWGYPVVINRLVPSKVNNGEFLLSGYFYSPPSVAAFSLQQPNVKFNFNNIRVKNSANGKISPIETEIELDVNRIPMFINQTFAGTLYNHKQIHTGPGDAYVLNTYGTHKIIKQDDKAVLQGIFQINLETFQSAYGFNGVLYVGSNTLGNKVEVFTKTIQEEQELSNEAQLQQSSSLIGEIQSLGQVSAPAVHIQQNSDKLKEIQPSNQSSPNDFQYTPNHLLEGNVGNMFHPRFNIFSLDFAFNPIPIRDYEVFGFPATSRNENTYLQGDKIYIQTVLHTDIPTCENCPNLDLEVLAGNIVVTKNDIQLVELPYDTLNFQLEEWKVYNKGKWYFDKNEEAIVLEKALVVTGKSINATVSNLKIRPNSLGEGTIDISEGGLSLGGIANIKLNGNLKPIFNYDPIGHYRISVVGSLSMDVPAGTVENLPQMDKPLEFEAIGLLSNGKDILTINKTFRFYDILDIEVTQIVSGNGYFDLQGKPILEVPGLIPEETAMRYKLNTQGTIVPELQPIKGGIDMPGYVYFSLDEERISHSVKKKEYKGYGTLYISPNANIDNRTFTLRGELIKTPGACKLEVFKVDNNKKYRGSIPQEMKVGNNKILVTNGFINTSNNHWDSLVYYGNTTNIEGLNDPSDPQNELTFVVNGDINVSSENLEVKNIDVGIGELKMVYNFDDASMRGTLEINRLPIGPAYVEQGQMSVNFNNNGYYFSLASESFYVGVAGQFKGGFIFGNTSSIYPEDINFFSKNFKVRLPDFANKGVTGMYAIGEKIIIDKKIDLHFVEASAKSGMGIYVNADLSNNYSFTVGGYGHARLKGERKFEELDITICEVGVCLSAFYNIEASYTKGNLSLNNCATISAIGYADGACTTPLEAIGIDPSLEFSISAEYGYSTSNGFHIGLDLFGGCNSGNSSNNKENCDD